MPPSALMPSATMSGQRFSWPVVHSRQRPHGRDGHGATRAPTACARGRARLDDDADHLVAERHRGRAAVDRVWPDRHRDRPEAHLVDVRAADRGRFDPEQHLGFARGRGRAPRRHGRRRGHASERPSRRMPADLGVERHRLLDQLVGDAPVNGVERHVAAGGAAAPAKIPWRTASSFRNWFEMSMCWFCQPRIGRRRSNRARAPTGRPPR